MKFDVGRSTYPTKKAATAFYREMLHSYRVGQSLTQGHHDLMLALVELHPGRDEKIGCGVVRFSVKLDEWGNKCFHIHRADGTDTDVSYRVCFNGGSYRTSVLLALRAAVHSDIMNARDQYVVKYGRAITCAASGKPLHLRDAHMDHRHPRTFAWMSGCFLAGLGDDYRAMLARDRDNLQGAELANPEVGRWFRDFHLEWAHLDFVEKSINLSQVKQLRSADPHIVLKEWVH